MQNNRWQYKGFIIYQKQSPDGKLLYDTYDRTGQLKFKDETSLFKSKIKIDDFITFNASHNQ